MEDKSEQYALGEVLQEIFHRRGFDIRNYKMSELQRKISSRMYVLDMANLVDYSEYLKANPQEYEILFNTILENRGQFFRDPKAWDILRNRILPEILERKNEIRIWSAGCAAGEEPYSLAITLGEILGDDISKYNISIYATDIDEAILKFARSGRYTQDQLAAMPESIKEKYFSLREDTYTISKDIKNLLIISHHNLLFDPPIPNIDLLLCRNVLIYFDVSLQLGVISKFQYALNEMSYLWLGKGDILSNEYDAFRPVDIEWRIFRKFSAHEQLQDLEKDKASTDRYSNIIGKCNKIKQIMQNMKFGFIMLDKNLDVVAFNHTINSLWGPITDESFGRSFFDLKISYSPVDLKSRIEQAVSTGETMVIEKTEHWLTSERRIYLKVEIIPIALAVIILLHDVTKYYEIEEELRITLRGSERAYEKLLSRNHELENTNTQFQRVNAELQSINEEIESRNEDLKARNEELDMWISDLSQLNEYYEMILNSIGFTVIITDRNLWVKTWKSSGADTWIVEENEVIGNSLMDLDMSISFKSLADQIQDVLNTARPANSSLQYTNSLGKETMLEISINPLLTKSPENPMKNEVKGLILIINHPILNALT